jgi:CubicO group peptidase (beta-lactamase class C family)
MQSRKIQATAVIALTLVFGCDQIDDPRSGTKVGDDNAVIDALFAPWDVPGSPGCAVAVSQDGALIYSRGYGYANLDYDIPITPQTVFDVGSVTKQFVAASLSMLALEGELSFEDDIRKWLPELPEYEEPITLRHMVYHTSGLRDYLNLFPLAGRGDYYPISRDQILDMMSRQRAVVFPPGERYRYSNTAYMLLALVVERISDQSIGEYVQERIFEPLEMQGSFMYEDFEEIIPRRATGYDSDGGVRMVHNYNFDVVGDGQMYTTVEDLLVWDNYLHEENGPAYYSIIMLEGTLNSGVKIDRAKGLFLREYRGLRTVYHTGSSWGFRTVVIRFVEPGLAIAIACNDDNSYPRSQALQVADHYLADQLDPRSDDGAPSRDDRVAEPASTAPALSSDQLAEFAGEYFSPELDATYRFAIDSGSLILRIEQEAQLDVVPVASDRFDFSFYPQGDRVDLVFDRNRAGAVTGFGLSSGSERGIVFERR